MNRIKDTVGKMSAEDLRAVLVGEQKELVMEGGKMFPDATRIHQENVAATLKYIYDTILPALDIDRKWVQPLGSTGKKLAGGTSGDIDLGIDATKCDFLEGITDTKEIVRALAEHCKPVMDDMGIESRMIPTLYSIKCPIQNFDGKQEGEFVQLDMMATRHMKFQNWSLYSPSEVQGKKFFKGAVRNSIIEAVAHAMDKVKVLKTGLVKFKDGIREDMVEWEEYSYFIQEGLNMKKCVRQPMKIQPKGASDTVYTTGTKDSRTLVTNDPDTIAKKMFGPKVKGKDLMDWESTWNAAKKAYWAKDNWDKFIESLREKMIDKMKAGVEIPPEILDATGLEPILANESTMIVKEGGNRFDYVTRINQKNAKPTMDEIRGKLKEFFGLKDDEIIFTGSTGKKLDSGSSGDVDCAISMTAIQKKFGIETPEEWFDICRDFAEKYDIDIDELPQYGFEGIAFAYPIVNSDGKQEDQYVQLDLIPDKNLKFRDWSQYAPAEKEGEDYVKGLVRNQIISAAAKVSGYKVLDKGKVNKRDGENNATKWERYSYSHQIGGLYKKTFERPLMKGKKGEEGFHKGSEEKTGMELVTDDPDEICEILFGVDSQNMLTWKDAWKAVKKVGILKDPKKEPIFREALKLGIEQAIKGGNLPYLPPELEKYLGIDDFKGMFGLAKKRKAERQAEEKVAAESTSKKKVFDESIKSTKNMSALDTPREAMTKIHQLTGKDLRVFLQNFINGVNNSSLLVKTTPKIDGYPFRVAWLDGKVMMELSYSGLLDKEGVEAITGKGVFPHERKFYDYVESHQNRKMAQFAKKIGLDGVKLVGELLANGDEFADADGTITYVGTTYDATKLGKNGSLVIIDVKGLNSEKAYNLDDDTKRKIVHFACSELSDANASYFDINQFAQEVDISRDDFPKEVIEPLSKTDPMDMKREEAERVRDSINAAMTDIMKRKFKNPDIMPKDDGSLEGVAFELGGRLYGIHYQSWKDIRNGYFSEIDEMANFTKKFLSQITGMPEKAGFSQMVNAIRNNPEKYQAKYEELLPKFVTRSAELIDNAQTRTDLPKFIDDISKSRANMLPQKFDPAQLTNDVMSLVDFVGGKVTDKQGQTIALIPGSFKPPHRGHFDMVKFYAEKCDEVIVAISGQTNVASQRKDKFGRTMPNFVAGQIMEIYCQAAGIEDKVSISMTLNPMNWVNSMLHHMSNCKVMLGLSSKDDPKRFDQFTNPKFVDTLQNVEILDVAKNAAPATTSGDENISATYVRDHIDDKKALRKVLPQELDNAQFEEVFKLMNPEGGKYPPMNDPSLAGKFNQKMKQTR